MQRGGPLLINAPTGSGKTVATLAPLLEHAEAADHKILYLVRTHSQEVQVLQEARTIAHRLDRPLFAIGLQGRARRCFLLENVAEVKGATAEEHGKLCADRKRTTERAMAGEAPLVPAPELPEGGEIDLTDLDGCPYYARVLQTDVETVLERFGAKLPTPGEFDTFAREENLCAYELAKRLIPRSRVVTAPYAFFFHPHIRKALYRWMELTPDRVDLVIDEAHNLPSHLRDLATVSLPQESVRRARSEVAERGDFQLPDGPSATRLLDIVGAAVEELVHALVREEDAVLPPSVFEDALLTALGGTTHRLDTWLGALATWGENLREERRRERHLPRSWAHTVALTLLSWPQLEPPGYVKVATRTPRPALEAYALDASGTRAGDPRVPHVDPPLWHARPARGVPRCPRAGRDRPPPGRSLPLPAGEPPLPLRPERDDPVRRPPPGPACRGPARRPPGGGPVLPAGQDGGLLPELRPPPAGPGRGPSVGAARERLCRVLQDADR